MLILVLALVSALVYIRFFVIRPPDTGVATPDTSLFPPDELPGYSLPSDVNVRKDIITMLIVGINEGNTDTIMVANIDLEKKVVNAISIPRDTIVGTTNRSLKKINGAYINGSLKGATPQERTENGFKQLQQEVAALVGYSPLYYAGVDMNGFVKLVDLIEGVDYDVPTRMYKPGRQLIDLQPGYQHLNGTKALMLVRYRGYGSKFGEYHDDFGRMHTQQEFLKAVAKKCASELSLTTAKGYLDVATTYLTSNMDVGRMGGLLEKSYDWIGKDGSMNFATLPTESVRTPSQAAKDRYYSKYGTISGSYYEQVKRDEALALINSMINPFDKPIDWVEYLDIK